MGVLEVIGGKILVCSLLERTIFFHGEKEFFCEITELRADRGEYDALSGRCEEWQSGTQGRIFLLPQVQTRLPRIVQGFIVRLFQKLFA